MTIRINGHDTLATYSIQDLIVMAESNGSHPECSQVPTAAVVQEITSRITDLEEAVSVLASCVHEAITPMCRCGLVGVVESIDFKVNNNPIAAAAIEKARKAD